MRNAKQPDASNNDRNGLALLAFALSLGGLAVAADIAWMAPHATSATMVSPATQEQEPAAQAAPAATSQSPQDAKTNAASDYFPSHFSVNVKDSDESPAPSF